MKTPWINYKGIDQFDRKRQTTFSFTSPFERSKLQSKGTNEAIQTETDCDYSKLDASPSPADPNEVKPKIGNSIGTQQDLPNIPDEMNRETIHQIVEELNSAIRSQSTIANYYIEYKSKTDLPGNLDITKCIGLKKDREVFIKFGLSQLVEEIRSNLPFELSLVPELPKIEEAPATEMNHEPVAFNDHEMGEIHVIDAASSQIELDKEKKILEEADILSSINLKERNRVAKQDGIVQLVNLLTKVQSNLIEASNKIDQPKSETEQFLTPDTIDNSNERLERDEVDGQGTSDDADLFSEDDSVFRKVTETPFSTYIEIDDFLHVPLSGEVSQNTIEFHDPKAQSFEIDSKFISTTAYYPHKPTCQLIKSTIHEIVYLTKKSAGYRSRKNTTIAKSSIDPLHRSAKKRKSKQPHESIKIRVPVVVGEYKIEICIEGEVLFGDEAVRIKEVSKDVVLTNCDFIPNRYAKAQEEGTRLVTNGMLLIEGLIVQNIEYTAISNGNESSQKRTGNLLHEIMTIELVVQLLQEQGIQVNCREI